MRTRTAEAFEIKGGEPHGDLGRCLKFRQASLAALVRIGAVESGSGASLALGRGIIGGSRMALS